MSYEDFIEPNEYMLAICQGGIRDSQKAIKITYLFQVAFGAVAVVCGVSVALNWPKFLGWLNLAVGLAILYQMLVWMPNQRNIYRNWEAEWGQKAHKHRFLLALLYAGEIDEYLNETANGI